MHRLKAHKAEQKHVLGKKNYQVAKTEQNYLMIQQLTEGQESFKFLKARENPLNPWDIQ